MKFLLKHQCLLVVFGVILATCILSSSAGPAKDKKKLLDKLRNALNQTEIEEAGNFTVEAVSDQNSTAELVPEAKASEEEDLEKAEVDAEDTVEDKKVEEAEKDDKPEVTDVQKVETPTPSYILRMRAILKRIFDLFGFRQSKKKEGRQNRMLTDDAYSFNGLEYDYFKEDIRTTVGAVLGEKECIQKIVCGAGSYLRSVNGKNVILTILDHVTPSAWLDTMDLLKQSAVTDGDCHYKCLEDDDVDEI